MENYSENLLRSSSLRNVFVGSAVDVSMMGDTAKIHPVVSKTPVRSDGPETAYHLSSWRRNNLQGRTDT